MARTSVKVEVTDLTDHDDEPMTEIPLVNRPQSLPRSSQNETSKRVNKSKFAIIQKVIYVRLYI